LCIGCLESRLGRELEPKDFQPDHRLNWLPGTERVMTPGGLMRPKQIIGSGQPIVRLA
jgi:hypothetical protein